MCGFWSHVCVFACARIALPGNVRKTDQHVNYTLKFLFVLALALLAVFVTDDDDVIAIIIHINDIMYLIITFVCVVLFFIVLVRPLVLVYYFRY